MEKEMKKVLLSDYLSACLAFEKDPSVENSDKIEILMQSIEVREYLPMKEKEIALAAILSSIPPDFDAIGSAGQLQISKLVYGLFSYGINLENDIGIMLFTFHAIDCFYTRYGSVSLVNYFLTRARDDYNLLMNMVDNAINLENIYKLLNTLSLFDTKEYDKWIQAMKDLKTDLSPEMLKELSTLASYGGGDFKDLEDELRADALEKAQEDTRKKIERAEKLVDLAEEREQHDN